MQMNINSPSTIYQMDSKVIFAGTSALPLYRGAYFMLVKYFQDDYNFHHLNMISAGCLLQPTVHPPQVKLFQKPNFTDLFPEYLPLHNFVYRFGWLHGIGATLENDATFVYFPPIKCVMHHLRIKHQKIASHHGGHDVSQIKPQTLLCLLQKQCFLPIF